MKAVIFCCFTFLLLSLACSVEKKVAYDFPDAMLPEVKVAYKERCDKGQALYNIACNGCHNKGTKRKPIVPDFSPDQLRGYALRISNKLHEKNMPDSLVSEEELGIIMTFLSYKRKNP
jgi:Cytochrome C oxidase, cbb3-type, subunit III